MKARAAWLLTLLALLLALAATRAIAQPDPLPSWNDGPAKQALLSFVRSATERGSLTYLPLEERIATFDQDGTLWVEQPIYTQAAFALARVRDLAAQHPEWLGQPPFDAILSSDGGAIVAFSESDWEAIVAATHAGMSVDDFHALVRGWLTTAVHARFGRPYTQLVYQPMLEVMDYLRANDFQVYIVTGGGQEFVRVYSRAVYAVSPAHVVGTSLLTTYEDRPGLSPSLMRNAKPFFVDDGPGKPVGINLFIGQRPAAAFGNSDGDRQMLEWTAAGPRARLMMLVLHDDADREYGYGPAAGLPPSHVGTFSDALMTDATSRGWTVISMRNDWNRLFPSST